MAEALTRSQIFDSWLFTRSHIILVKRVLYVLANLWAGLVLVLLLIDPTRPLAAVLGLLGLAVVCVVMARFLPR
jgi:hypothetical protein